MKRLIVNADDLGLTEGVNRAILDSHHRGIVTSTSLLANGAAFYSGATESRAEPRLSVGVHLNLSQGAPVSPPTSVPSLVDGRGELHLTPGRLQVAIAGGQASLVEIEAELRAQIRRAIEVGIAPSHLDGHMHVHVLPGVAEVAVKLACEFHIAAMRCPVEPIARAMRPLPKPARASATPSATGQRLTALAVSTLGRRLRRLADRAGIAHPARFYGIVETGLLDARSVEQILRAMPDDGGVSELMCHPGYVDGDLAREGGRLQAERETEVQALTSPEIIALVETLSVQLVSYRELE